MEKKEFGGFKYYNILIDYDEVLNLIEEGIYPISTNELQSREGIKFLEDLYKISGLFIYLDYDENSERSDTVFIEFEDISIENIKKVFELVLKTRPNEANFNKKGNILRIWWD